MAGHIELGRVTIVSQLAVESYDEESGAPVILAGTRPNLVAEVELDEAVTLGSNRNALQMTKNMLTGALRSVDEQIAEWDAEHIGSLDVPEDATQSTVVRGDGPSEGWKEADTDV